MDDKEFSKSYYELSVAQRRYIFDRSYISTNPKTREVLVRKGYVIPRNEMKKIYKNGILQPTTQFTTKCHDMVKFSCYKKRETQKIAFPDHLVISNDTELLDIISEMILLAYEDIEIFMGKHGFISTTSYNYILDPYYRWQIEIDKTAGRFLRHYTYHRSHYYKYDGNYYDK